MTPVDWNWYYAALAQSAAAIVALFGALALNRLLADERDSRALWERIEDAAIETGEWQRRTSDIAFQWLVEQRARATFHRIRDDIDAAADTNGGDVSPEDILRLAGDGLIRYSPPDAVFKLALTEAEAARERYDERQPQAAPAGMFGAFAGVNAMTRALRLPETHPLPAMEREEERADEGFARCEAIANTNQILVGRATNLEETSTTLPHLLLGLLVLFWVAVALPLALLPTSGEHFVGTGVLDLGNWRFMDLLLSLRTWTWILFTSSVTWLFLWLRRKAREAHDALSGATGLIGSHLSAGDFSPYYATRISRERERTHAGAIEEPSETS